MRMTDSAGKEFGESAGDGCEGRVAPQGAEAVADVPADFIEEAQADGGAIFFVLSCGLAEVDARSAAALFGGEALADQSILIGIEGKAEFFFDVTVGAWCDHAAESMKKTHISSALLSRMAATTAAMSVHFAVSALSWRVPAPLSE
jgi:hypothetical protein